MKQISKRFEYDDSEPGYGTWDNLVNIVDTANENFTNIDSSLQNLNINQTNTVYVSKIGNDSNTGLNPLFPKLTIGSALNTAFSLDPSINNPIEVNISAGTYTENIDVSSNINLIGPSCTIEGSLTINNNNSIDIYKHVSSESSQQMLVKLGSTSTSYYRTVISDGRGFDKTKFGCLNIVNITDSAILFIDIQTLIVDASGVGIIDIATGSGHIHFKIKDLYLGGNDSTGLASFFSLSDQIGFIDHILNIGSPLRTTGINIASGSILKLMTNEIRCPGNTAYNVDGSLYLTCPLIIGTQDGSAYLTDYTLR